MNDSIKTTLETIRNTMKVVKGSLKNTAILRTLTNLNTEIGNTTRWKYWGTMAMKYKRTWDHLSKVSQYDEKNYKIGTSLFFWRKCEAVKSIFEDINMVAVSMQKRMYKLSQCRNDLDLSLSESNEN